MDLEEKKPKQYINADALREKEHELEEKTEEIAEEMEVNLPGVGLSLPLRVISLFTLIGGFSIIGSMFADIVNPDKTNVFAYLGRLFVGLVAVTVSYGILHLKRWSLWLYGFIALVGLAINPAVAIFPVIVTIYLYKCRKQFEPSVIDFMIGNIISSLKSMLLSKLGKKGPPQIQ
jgi:hypothetical protein